MPLNGSEENLAIESPTQRDWKLLDRLPELYRERPELLGPIVDAAEDLLSHLSDELGRGEAEAGVGRGIVFGPLSGAVTCSTTGGVAQTLAAAVGSTPRVWNGLEARRHPAGGLTFGRASRRSAVVAWEKEQLDSLPPSFRLRVEWLPVGVQIFFVALGRLPERGVPRAGERFAGEVLRAWRGIPAEETSRWT